MTTEPTTKQTPINNTVQVTVPPGDKTGLYYILISNFPWQTSWQQVKDFVRTVCPAVERVEIFNDSTSGWVSVRGRENFHKAYNFLSTEKFGTEKDKSRCLLIDGRNATESVPIKKLVVRSAGDMQAAASPQSPRTPRTQQPMQYLASSPSVISPTMSIQGQWSSNAQGGSSIVSPVHQHDYGGPTQAPPYEYADPSSYYSYDGSGYGHYAAPVLHTGMSPSPYTAYQQPHQSWSHSGDAYGGEYYASSSYTPSLVSAQESTGTSLSEGVVLTEKRKIIIKNLSSRTEKKHVEALLLATAGLDGASVVNVSVPLSRTTGGARGYATVVLAREADAAQVVSSLHGHFYHGKNLDVDYTTERVSRNEDGGRSSGGGGRHSSSHHHHHHSSSKHHHHHHDDEGGGGGGGGGGSSSSGGSKGAAAGPSSSQSQSSSSKKDDKRREIVIAHGSSSRKPGEGSKKTR